MKENKGNKKVALTSPTIKRSGSADCRSKSANLRSAPTAYPKLLLHDILNQTYVQPDDSTLFYKDFDTFRRSKNCTISLSDILFQKGCEQQCQINKCENKKCKTCPILITENKFKSCFTGKTFYTKSWDRLSCKSANLVYCIECDLMWFSLCRRNKRTTT